MPEWVLILLGNCVTAAGLYGAIRADLREALTRAGTAEKLGEKAHERINDLLMKGNCK